MRKVLISAVTALSGLALVQGSVAQTQQPSAQPGVKRINPSALR
jgi:hypothetical protein